MSDSIHLHKGIRFHFGDLFTIDNYATMHFDKGKRICFTDFLSNVDAHGTSRIDFFFVMKDNVQCLLTCL